VYAATSEAVARALAGDGPTLIEALTYRMGFHNTTDNPKAYRDDAEVADAARRDPIARVEHYLARAGAWDDARALETERSIQQELENAFATASQFAPPDPSQIFEHVYADVPERVRKQKEELEDFRRNSPA
jgi:pyruvate dehydrogenase E1 component alpha subunit